MVYLLQMIGNPFLRNDINDILSLLMKEGMTRSTETTAIIHFVLFFLDVST